MTVDRAVVFFDHPQEVPLDHALCIDFRTGDPATRVSVELDAGSARLLTELVSGEAPAIDPAPYDPKRFA